MQADEQQGQAQAAEDQELSKMDSPSSGDFDPDADIDDSGGIDIDPELDGTADPASDSMWADFFSWGGDAAAEGEGGEVAFDFALCLLAA